MTNYFNDHYKTYRDEPLAKKLKYYFKKYFVLDAGQLVIGIVGLVLMFTL